MKVLLLLSSAVLLCSAAPVLEPVTCSEGSAASAAHLAMHHIDEHHDHGYKFKLDKIQGIKVVKVDGGCDVELQLDLLETKCHIINPKHFEDCELRGFFERAVMANCTVMMTVKGDDAKVTKYECDTRQVKTDAEMMLLYPDSPTLIPLHNTEGLKSVDEAVKRFNQNTTNQRYYILREVGRILLGYKMMPGYNAEIALVETHCPMGSRIVLEACKPLCPDRAHHALCRSSYSTDTGLRSVECEFYPPSNTTALSPGEQEPVCWPPHHLGPPHRPGGRRPPPHAGHGCPPHVGGRRPGVGGPRPLPGVVGPPPHAGVVGPPPHAGVGGPPPHVGVGGPPPPHAVGIGPPPGHDRHHRGPPFFPHHSFPPFHPCHSFNFTSSDPALHPICPWPYPEPLLCPRQS